jgi:hypothetical protein
MISSFLWTATIPALLIISAVAFLTSAILQLRGINSKLKTVFIIRFLGFLLLSIAIAAPTISFINNLAAAIITILSSLLIALSYILKSKSAATEIKKSPKIEDVGIKNNKAPIQGKAVDVAPVYKDISSPSPEPQQPVKAVVTPTQATRSAIKKETGLRAAPLVRLPAQKRKKARALVNTLVGFVVFFLVGWGSYTVAKRIIKPESGMDDSSPEINEEVTTPVLQDNGLLAPQEEQPTEPSPTDEPIEEDEEEVISEPEKTLTIKDTETGFLNVREGSNTATAIVTKIDPGDTYELLDENETSTWYKIQVDDDTAGWISAKYADKNE